MQAGGVKTRRLASIWRCWRRCVLAVCVCVCAALGTAHALFSGRSSPATGRRRR
jgi:hypothetical protein